MDNMILKVFTAFSGYDSQCMALDLLKEHNPGFDYELVGWAEIDKYAIQAHDAVYPQWKDRNFGDISKIDWEQVPDFDLFTYSSPCQDFSQAGKQAGGTEGSGTRSSLLWECRRAILAKRPKYLLMENVAALVSQKFIRLFNAWQLELESYGYRNFAKVLNAKDYGVPQNRERIFMVSVLDESFRYEFPKPMPLTLRLKDVLEKEVAERYYLHDSKDKRLAQIVSEQGDKIQDGDMLDTYNQQILHDTSATILCGIDSRRHHFIAEEPIVYDDYNQRVREDQDTIGTITTNCGTMAPRNGFKILEPQVMTPKRTEYGKAIRKQYEAGEIQEQRSNLQQFEPRNDGVSNTLTGVQKDNYVVEPLHTDKEGNALCISTRYAKESTKKLLGNDGSFANTIVRENSYRIRKLTERECFRLMDMPEHYIDRIQESGICRSQQYKMAGNSIVVACLYYIFDRLFINTTPTELTLF